MLDINKINTISIEEYKKVVDKDSLNDLEKYFLFEKHRLINKWFHYFEIYDRHFSKYRNQDVVVVEIGVYKGGSLQMWKNYFGDKCKIIGIDIEPSCKQYEEDQIEVIIGSQEDKNFLQQLKSKIPKIDILIDDGGHYMNQQKTTFEELFNHISENGIYLCEDLHTSYWQVYGGGYKNIDSFIEYSKNFIDYINAWHSHTNLLQVSDFTRTAHSIHYYDSVIVIEKRLIYHPGSYQSVNE